MALPDDDVFGYQERYAEYRYKPSKVMKPQVASNFVSRFMKWIRDCFTRKG